MVGAANERHGDGDGRLNLITGTLLLVAVVTLSRQNLAPATIGVAVAGYATAGFAGIPLLDGGGAVRLHVAHPRVRVPLDILAIPSYAPCPGRWNGHRAHKRVGILLNTATNFYGLNAP